MICPGIILVPKISENNLVKFVKIILENMLPLAYSSYITHLSINIINIDVEFSEISRQENCALIFPRSTCLDVYETLVSQRGKYGRGEGRRQACRATTTFVFESLQSSEEVLTFPHSLGSAQFLEKCWRCS